MQEAVAFDHTDKFWDADKIPGRRSLLKTCQGLVVQAPGSETVQFAHYTIQQYLFTSDVPSTWLQEPSTSRGEGHYRLSMENAQVGVADLCVTYLNFSDFETAITPRAQDLRFEKNSILGPRGPGAIAGSVGLGKPVFDAIYRVMGRSTRPTSLDIDYGKYLSSRKPSAAIPQDGKHEFLGYIVENWPWHIKVSPWIPKPRYWDVLRKNLPFEFRPWGPDRHFGPYGCNFCSPESPSRFQPRELTLTSMIHWAAVEGNCDLLMVLENDELGEHLLHEKYSKETMILACRMGHTTVIEFLLEAFPNICWDSSLLIIAASAGHVETLRTLRKYQKKLGYQRDESQTDLNNLLFKAATNGHASVVQYLVEYGVDFDFRDYLTETTPLQSAITNGHEDVVCALALSGFDVDDKDRSGATALHRSVQQGNLSMTVCLVECGASLESKDEEEKVPLDLGIIAGHGAVTDYLLAQPLYRDQLGDRTVLVDPHRARVDWEFLPHRKLLWVVAFGHKDSLEISLGEAAKESTDLIDDFGEGMSLIHVAAYYENALAVKLLLNKYQYSLLNTPTRYLCTPLHFAAHSGCLAILEELLGYQVDPNSTTVHGWTPLHFAARSGKVHCIMILLNYGADLNASTNLDQGSMTALHLLGMNVALCSKKLHTPYHLILDYMDIIRELAHEGAELKKCNTAGETVYEIVAKESMFLAIEFLEIEEKSHTPPLWHLKHLMDSLVQGREFDIAYLQSIRYMDRDLKVADQQLGLYMSYSISRGTFNDHEVVYARHLMDFAKQAIEKCTVQPTKCHKLELLVFLLEQTIAPSDANFKVIPSSESSTDSPDMRQPPNSPDEID